MSAVFFAGGGVGFEKIISAMRRISRAVLQMNGVQYNSNPFPTPSGLILESQVDTESDTELVM